MNSEYGIWKQSDENDNIYFANKTLRLEIGESLVDIYIYNPVDFKIAEIPYKTNDELEDILWKSQSLTGIRQAFDLYKKYL